MGASTNSPGGKGNVTTPGQGGQPAFGQPSASTTSLGNLPAGQEGIFSEQGSQYGGQQGGQAINQGPLPNSLGQQYQNTIGGWDNATIQPQQSQSGKAGKGQSSWQPFQSSWTPPVQPATNVQTNVQPVANQPMGGQYDYTGSGY